MNQGSPPMNEGHSAVLVSPGQRANSRAWTWTQQQSYNNPFLSFESSPFPLKMHLQMTQRAHLTNQNRANMSGKTWLQNKQGWNHLFILIISIWGQTDELLLMMLSSEVIPTVNLCSVVVTSNSWKWLEIQLCPLFYNMLLGTNP